MIDTKLNQFFEQQGWCNEQGGLLVARKQDDDVTITANSCQVAAVLSQLTSAPLDDRNPKASSHELTISMEIANDLPLHTLRQCVTYFNNLFSENIRHRLHRTLEHTRTQLANYALERGMIPLQHLQRASTLYILLQTLTRAFYENPSDHLNSFLLLESYEKQLNTLLAPSEADNTFVENDALDLPRAILAASGAYGFTNLRFTEETNRDIISQCTQSHLPESLKDNICRYYFRLNAKLNDRQSWLVAWSLSKDYQRTLVKRDFFRKVYQQRDTLSITSLNALLQEGRAHDLLLSNFHGVDPDCHSGQLLLSLYHALGAEDMTFEHLLNSTPARPVQYEVHFYDFQETSTTEAYASYKKLEKIANSLAESPPPIAPSPTGRYAV